MNIERIDHLVLTTSDLEKCLHFYRDILGMKVRCKNDRCSIYFGKQKINIHARPGEFLPAAAMPMPGALDLCFVVKEPIADIVNLLKAQGVMPETGIVERNGALGKMRSVYVRDPDGNLIELCNYEGE